MDLVQQYSLRSDVLDRLDIATNSLRKALVEPAVRRSVQSELKPRAWAMSDRLSDEDVKLLIKEYQAGALGQQLADKYKISLSSVRRLLKKYNARLKDS